MLPPVVVAQVTEGAFPGNLATYGCGEEEARLASTALVALTCSNPRMHGVVRTRSCRQTSSHRWRHLRTSILGSVLLPDRLLSGEQKTIALWIRKRRPRQKAVIAHVRPVRPTGRVWTH